MSKALQSLGEHVKRRRIELGLTQRDAYDTAGLSTATWGNIETQHQPTSPDTWRKVEKVLAWAPGSIEQILEGGLPTPIQDAPPKPPITQVIAQLDKPNRDLLEQVIADMLVTSMTSVPVPRYEALRLLYRLGDQQLDAVADVLQDLIQDLSSEQLVEGGSDATQSAS